MLRFFSKTPGWGIDIASSSIRLALVARHGSALSVLHAENIDLPAGLVTEGYSSENIRDLDDVASRVRACIAASPAASSRAALSLPDGVFRVQTLEFDQLPGPVKDRDRLIRWRLEKTAAFDLSGTVLRYQVLRQRGQGMTVLACVIKQQVLEQYEGLLGRLGLEPWSVGLSSFHTLNFFSPLIGRKASAAALACVGDESFTTIVAEAGGARFYRYKEMKRGSTGDVRERLCREIGDSLHFYMHRDRALQSAVDRLYLSGDPASTQALADELRSSLSLEVTTLASDEICAVLGEKPAGTFSIASMTAALGAGSAL